MVCMKCQKRLQTTSLATPAVKKKGDIYFGSPAASAKTGTGKATLGNSGIGKSKLLSNAARNPYAAYANSCSTCKTKVDKGRKLCAKCSYKSNSCPGCGKGNSKSTDAAPVIEGVKRTLK